jgi:hypothetical protein
LRFARTSLLVSNLWQDICSCVSTCAPLQLLRTHEPEACSDLLKRHSANHENDQPTTPAAKRRKTLPDIHRPRASRACQACADAKARCEGDRPCLRCQQKSIACEYPPSRSTEGLGQGEGHHRTGPPASGPQDCASTNLLNDPSSVVPPPGIDQMTDQRRSDIVDPHNVNGFQASNFHLPTPPFGPGGFVVRAIRPEKAN